MVPARTYACGFGYTQLYSAGQDECQRDTLIHLSGQQAAGIPEQWKHGGGSVALLQSRDTSRLTWLEAGTQLLRHRCPQYVRAQG